MRRHAARNAGHGVREQHAGLCQGRPRGGQGFSDDAHGGIWWGLTARDGRGAWKQGQASPVPKGQSRLLLLTAFCPSLVQTAVMCLSEHGSRRKSGLTPAVPPRAGIAAPAPRTGGFVRIPCTGGVFFTEILINP